MKQHKFIKIIIAILIILSALSFVAIKSVSDENLHLYFLDVGQGDSVYVRYKNIDLLVDGGPDDSALYEIGKYMPFYDNKIEYVVLTHPHADHLDGLVDIIRHYDIGTIYITGFGSQTDAYKEFLHIINSKQIPISYIDHKYCQNIQKYYDICFYYPISSLKEAILENANNASIVSQIVFGGIKIMLTGDLEKEKLSLVAQENGLALDSDIIKASHHGASNGLNDVFMRFVSPELSVISVGEKNKYGHPSQEVIDYFDKNNIRYYRTDKDGTIEIISNGINFWTK